MKPRSLRMLLCIIGLLAIVMAVVSTFAKAQPQTPKKGEFKTTIVGTIDRNEDLGGYFVRGERPGGEFMIVNQNSKVLEPLMKSKKTATIEGTLRGAEFLTILKIDGKPYPGKGAPK